MKYTQLGTTDVKVSAISFGCASIGNLFRETTDADAHAVLDAAWANGIRYFDTAPHYGRGLSETRLGQFLSTKDRADFVISTKVGRVLSPGTQLAEADGYINPLPNDVRYDYSGDGIEASLESSLERLQTTRVEIAYVHDIGVFTHGPANDQHMEAFLGSGYERLVRLKEKGRIGAFGLGVNENEICLEVMKHGPIDVILLAGRLTLLDRTAEEALVPLCVKTNTSLVLGGVLNSGILATGAIEGATFNYEPAPAEILEQVKALDTRAQQLGMPLATAALLYAKSHPMSASVLIGTAKASTLVRNVAALSETVPEGFAAAFDL